MVQNRIHKQHDLGALHGSQPVDNVRQLDAISRELPARLWAAGAGPADLTAPLTIDLDSTIVDVHGRPGAAFGSELGQ